MNKEIKKSYKNFGKVIKKLRLDNGLSLLDVAKIIEIPMTTFYEYEKKGTKMPVDVAAKLAAVFQFDVFESFKFQLSESVKQTIFMKKQKLLEKKFRSESSEEMQMKAENMGIVSKRNFEDSGHSIRV